jgi:xylulokinase
MSLLGIDVGTSGCKAAVFSLDGHLQASAYEEYDFYSPKPGWAEIDTQQVWKQVKNTIQTVSPKVTHDPIQALCVSSLGEAVVPVTADRKILGPSMLNFDARGNESIAELRMKLDNQQLYQINGNTLGNFYTLSKLMWLKKNQPDLYNQVDWFLHWSGFVSFMLGADPSVDYSLANRTLLFDLVSNDWSEELLILTGVDREKLPPTVPSGAKIGNVSTNIARELGIPAGIPIISGGHDQCCNGLGCGVIELGQAMYGMGTYICMMPVFDRRPASYAMISQGINTEHHVVPGKYVSFIYNQGGVLVKWFRDTFAIQDHKMAAANGTDIYDLLTAEMPEHPSSLMVLPHFTATGPPAFISDSSGVIAGLHLDTSRGEILKGVIEATTFYMRECLESLPEEIVINKLWAAGGGSKSPAWLQICADVLGRPFIQPVVTEAGALGAAILAGTGSRNFKTIHEGVEAMVRLKREFYPHPESQQRYNERFEKYRQMWLVLKEYLRN